LYGAPHRLQEKNFAQIVAFLAGYGAPPRGVAHVVCLKTTNNLSRFFLAAGEGSAPFFAGLKASCRSLFTHERIWIMSMDIFAYAVTAGETQGEEIHRWSGHLWFKQWWFDLVADEQAIERGALHEPAQAPVVTSAELDRFEANYFHRCIFSNKYIILLLKILEFDMDNYQLERRISALEEAMDALKKTLQKAYEEDSLRMLKIERTVEGIQDQLKEYDMVRTAVIRSYARTHPEVTRDMVRLEEILGTLPPGFKKHSSD
jgi:hypothetical protein